MMLLQRIVNRIATIHQQHPEHVWQCGGDSMFLLAVMCKQWNAQINLPWPSNVNSEQEEMIYLAKQLLQIPIKKPKVYRGMRVLERLSKPRNLHDQMIQMIKQYFHSHLKHPLLQHNLTVFPMYLQMFKQYYNGFQRHRFVLRRDKTIKNRQTYIYFVTHLVYVGTFYTCHVPHPMFTCDVANKIVVLLQLWLTQLTSAQTKNPEEVCEMLHCALYLARQFDLPPVNLEPYVSFWKYVQTLPYPQKRYDCYTDSHIALCVGLLSTQMDAKNVE